MEALLKYTNTLDIVTGNQYRYHWTQMRIFGYQKTEPVVIPKESPGLDNKEIWH